jgi:type I restriction enzyme S subunit
MKSNYKRIGDYIREIKVRNTDDEKLSLLGINIDKFFMPSVANIVGTDLSTYKIVCKSQFACNRMHVGRDKRLPVAMSKGNDKFMVSPAYDVFEISDTSILLPEYLMMWFSRKEFDRNTWFYTDADVRGGLSWQSFCDMRLPIPPIEKQREIVAEYHAVQKRINLNNQLIQTLEATAQAIYKQWFVDFEFPDAEGKPYKSNSGEMVETEMGEVPKGWRVGCLGEIVQTQYGYTASAEINDVGPKFLRITDITNGHIDWDNVPHCNISKNEFEKYELKIGDIVVARTGATVGCAKRINKQHPKAVFASYLVRLIPNNTIWNIYLGITINSQKYKDFILSNAEGSAQPQANASLMTEYSIINPSINVILKFNKIIEPFLDQIEFYQVQNSKLNQLKELLLSKMAKGEIK